MGRNRGNALAARNAARQIHAAYSGASRHQVMWHMVLKAALPEILTGMRISFAFFAGVPMRRVERVLMPWKGKGLGGGPGAPSVMVSSVRQADVLARFVGSTPDSGRKSAEALTVKPDPLRKFASGRP